ncbi:hypothetical protein SDC9_194870 [bioreactor metagenome]|uniref:Uncharacterized protein n=1 Tax=bioreactor metagenome TaxID=1076179 RepID=A0A645I7N1_9ZZZZ
MRVKSLGVACLTASVTIAGSNVIRASTNSSIASSCRGILECCVSNLDFLTKRPFPGILSIRPTSSRIRKASLSELRLTFSSSISWRSGGRGSPWINCPEAMRFFNFSATCSYIFVDLFFVILLTLPKQLKTYSSSCSKVNHTR